jgi:hypothetical protein
VTGGTRAEIVDGLHEVFQVRTSIACRCKVCPSGVAVAALPALPALEQGDAAMPFEIGDALAGRWERNAEAICARVHARTLWDLTIPPEPPFQARSLMFKDS